MGQARIARLRKFGAAIAVLLVHLLALQLFVFDKILIGREDAERRISWINFRPQEPSIPNSEYFRGIGAATLPALPPVAYSFGPMTLPRTIILPPSVVEALPRADIMATVGKYLSCDLAHYDMLSELEKSLCSPRLFAYDETATYIFTADQELARAAWAAEFLERNRPGPAAEMAANAYKTCRWQNGLCWEVAHANLGLQPMEATARLGLVKTFALAEGLSLTAGVQAEPTGSQPYYLIGVALTYHW